MPNMRRDFLVFALAFACTCYGCGKLNAGTRAAAITSVSAAEKPAPVSADTSPKVDFPTQIKPIFEARCQPCHFSGGKVYSKMPFDRPETIRTLGTKLFTRIKDENERQLISSFLAQQ
jgi:hypothetical protein